MCRLFIQYTLMNNTLKREKAFCSPRIKNKTNKRYQKNLVWSCGQTCTRQQNERLAGKFFQSVWRPILNHGPFPVPPAGVLHPTQSRTSPYTFYITSKYINPNTSTPNVPIQIHQSERSLPFSTKPTAFLHKIIQQQTKRILLHPKVSITFSSLFCVLTFL